MKEIRKIRIRRVLLDDSNAVFLVYAFNDSFDNKKICSIVWNKDKGFKIHKYFINMFEANMILGNIQFISCAKDIMSDKIGGDWKGISFSMKINKEYIENAINQMFEKGVTNDGEEK